MPACSFQRRGSPTARVSIVGPEKREKTYYAILFGFWAILLAVPLAGNLAAAWLLVEATTAASALLVGFSGLPRALEAGWKYLILTSLGLGVALLGIVMLAAGVPGGGLAALSWSALGTYMTGSETALVAYLLLLAGLAAKIGWAPVHNWLPDAHSEAPPPVSALLSAALLPAVLLVAWRSQQSLAAVVGRRATARRPHRLRTRLARSRNSVPLALAALEAPARVLEPRAHGRDRARDRIRHAARTRRCRRPHHGARRGQGARFLRGDAASGSRATRLSARRDAGLAARKPALGATMGISLAALAGLPPSPLFVSEVHDRRRRVPGGHGRGRRPATALLLALGFLGLAHALIERSGWQGPQAGRAPRAAACAG